MDKDGINIERTRGTPRGGVISPILSNLFLHYTFDLWVGRTHPDLPWCRYADDGLVHCRTEKEAQALKADLQTRLAECGLEMHPIKTKIVYCKDSRRKGSYTNVKFDFLGYCFRTRRAKNSQDASVFCSFLPPGFALRRCSPCGRQSGTWIFDDDPMCRWLTSRGSSIRS
jgi:RNA-directed DNA polymerase